MSPAGTFDQVVDALSYSTPEEQRDLEYFQRPSKVTKRHISDLEETIIEMREGMKTKSRFEKNIVENQILNRISMINHFNKILSHA